MAKTIRPRAGQHISAVAKEAVDLVAAGEPSVSFTFNDTMLTVVPGMTVDDVCAAFNRRLEQRLEAPVTIRGVQLDSAQVMALRVAVTSMLDDLYSDEQLCKGLGETSDLYKARLREVQDLLVRP